MNQSWCQSVQPFDSFPRLLNCGQHWSNAQLWWPAIPWSPMRRLFIPHIKPSVREIMIKCYWAPGLFRFDIATPIFGMSEVWNEQFRRLSELSELMRHPHIRPLIMREILVVTTLTAASCMSGRSRISPMHLGLFSVILGFTLRGAGFGNSFAAHKHYRIIIVVVWKYLPTVNIERSVWRSLTNIHDFNSTLAPFRTGKV